MEYLRSDNSALEEGWIVDGEDLELGKLIDAGAYGEVYNVKHKHRLCIKILNSRMVALGALDDLEQEIRFLKRIRHPNLVRFYGAGEVDHKGHRTPFLLLEYANRGSLRNLVRGSRETQAPPHLDWDLRVKLMADVARGLAHIHSLGPEVMHRDLKTANILVFAMDATAETLVAKVTDFGSVRLGLLHNQSASLAHDNERDADTSNADTSVELTAGVGTYLYMAPEVISGGKTYTQAVDVFSFGVMLWEVAMQQPPDLIVQVHGPKHRWRSWELERLLAEGHRLRLEDTHPDWYRALMHACFKHEPRQRPCALELVDAMESRALGMMLDRNPNSR
eukprot:TRINITY_DN12279_c1_g1_i10.p1 TRINITY_DN12279_c1_g1~~TRINITY_DN12279_c1_g1_i10.p1  ORF type:complete len:376 (+),score=51.18 TRINITY_DN12279_c1_g1_i10:126-1130(+)